MGWQTIYRKKNLTKQGIKQFIRLYLLRNLKITHANQVWCTDITYIPMAGGFMYMISCIDVYSLKIMGWSIRNSMSKHWCIAALKEAIAIDGKPKVINSDQGSQVTRAMWTQYLESQSILISLDGKGRPTDKTCIERFWKILKYDYIYLNPCNNGFGLFEGVQNHVVYYNQRMHRTTGQSPNKRYDVSIQCQAA